MRIGDYELAAAPTPKQIQEDKQTRIHVYGRASPMTGERPLRKYLISRRDEGEQGIMYFVSVLDHGFQYLAQINPWKGSVYTTHHSVFPEGSPELGVFRRTLDVLYGRAQLPDGFDVYTCTGKVKKEKEPEAT